MAECYRCGISDERERLFECVSNKGVVKICKSCANEDNLPLVQPVDLNKPERVKSVYERLSAMANLDPERHKKMLLERAKEDSRRRPKQDTTLKDVINANLEKKKPQPRTDLVDNFHWVIMRMRRSKKLTQKQLAEKIGESESIVRSAEEGTILNNADTFVRKLESYLGVKLRKGESPYSSEEHRLVKAGISEDPAKREIREIFEKEGNFDSKTAETLTISDLQEIKKKKEAESSDGFFSFLRKNRKQESVKPEENIGTEEKKKLSEEEVNDILFKK